MNVAASASECATPLCTWTTWGLRSRISRRASRTLATSNSFRIRIPLNATPCACARDRSVSSGPAHDRDVVTALAQTGRGLKHLVHRAGVELIELENLRKCAFRLQVRGERDSTVTPHWYRAAPDYRARCSSASAVSFTAAAGDPAKTRAMSNRPVDRRRSNNPKLGKCAKAPVIRSPNC